MKARKIMEAMGLLASGEGISRLRELIRFHLAMGIAEKDIPALITKQAEDIRELQQGNIAQRKEQAMQFLWQRFRNTWPKALKIHKAASASGATSYYYTKVGQFEAPPSWAYVLEGEHLILASRWPFKAHVIRMEDYLARYAVALSVEIKQEAPTADVITPAPVMEPENVVLPPKRVGKETRIKTRPEQLSFSQAVEDNCFDTCVVTGSRIHGRCEAAHLVEHSADGIDHYTNGLWLRADIHDLFDDGYCAINPETLALFFTDEALALDPDLAAFHGKALRPTKRPINPEFLRARWDDFHKIESLATSNLCACGR